MNRDFMELMADLEIAFGLIMVYSLVAILRHLDISTIPIYVIAGVYGIKTIVIAYKYYKNEEEE